MKYRPEIDGLRAIAVMSVILFHAGVPFLSGGFVGVDIFFVISGYLITSIILLEKQNRTFSLINFYERRARRILPPLFLIMLVSLPIAWLTFFPPQLRNYFQSLIAVSTFSSNILFWLETGYWGPANELKPLLHTWTLAVEEQYYILFPLFLMCIWRLKKPVLKVMAIVITVLFSLIAAQWGAYHKPSGNFFLLPTRAWELAIGAGVAYFHTLGNEKTKITFPPLIRELIAMAGLLMLAYAILMHNQYTPYPSFYTIIPTAGAALIILNLKKTWVSRCLSHPLFVKIGLISYSLYLWHQIVFSAIRHEVMLGKNTALLICSIPFIFALSWFTYRYIETPFRDKGKITRKQIFIFSILGSAFFISVGLFGQFNAKQLSRFNGGVFQERFDEIHGLKVEREKYIQSGICQFNGKGLHKTIDAFVSNWSCLSNDEKGLIPTKIAVFGDSHGVDKALALRQNGFDVLQLGGAGCSMLPGTNDEYDRLIALFLKAIAQNDINTLFLSWHFGTSELTPEYIQKVFYYWAKTNKKILFFSPMPEFDGWEKYYIRNGVIKFSKDLTAHEHFFDALEKVNIPKNIKIVNTFSLFCEKGVCKITDAEGNPLLIDYAHLSVTGARRLGHNLLELYAIPSTQHWDTGSSLKN